MSGDSFVSLPIMASGLMYSMAECSRACLLSRPLKLTISVLQFFCFLGRLGAKSLKRREREQRACLHEALVDVGVLWMFGSKAESTDFRASLRNGSKKLEVSK